MAANKLTFDVVENLFLYLPRAHVFNWKTFTSFTVYFFLAFLNIWPFEGNSFLQLVLITNCIPMLCAECFFSFDICYLPNLKQGNFLETVCLTVKKYSFDNFQRLIELSNLAQLLPRSQKSQYKMSQSILVLSSVCNDQTICMIQMKKRLLK